MPNRRGCPPCCRRWRRRRETDIKRAFALSLAALLCIAGTSVRMPRAAATSLDAAAAAQVDEVALEWLKSTGAPSVSLAIVQRGALAYAKAYGLAHEVPGVSATAASRYAIDSVSKQFTAAAILLLAQQDKLSLDDPLAKWFAHLGEASRVTLRQLLTHTSGIRDYWPQDFLTPPMIHPTTPQAIIEEWAARPLDFVPGTDWQYSNTGYVLAGEVVERVSGEPLFELLQRRIFSPLAMTHVADYASPPTDSAPEDAAGYTRFGLGPVIQSPKEGAGWLFGAADLAMRPDELALWDISLIDRSLLDANSYAAQRSPVLLADGSRRPYGLGLHIEDTHGRFWIGHAGSGSGFLAEDRVWPNERTAIVILTNNDWASPEGLLERIAFLVLPPTPEEARARALFAGFQNGTVDRSLFTATGNFHLTDEVLADLHASLAGLGRPRLIELEQEYQRGGMVTRSWKIFCDGARLTAIERGYPGGRLDEFMITKAEE